MDTFEDYMNVDSDATYCPEYELLCVSKEKSTMEPASELQEPASELQVPEAQIHFSEDSPMMEYFDDGVKKSETVNSSSKVLLTNNDIFKKFVSNVLNKTNDILIKTLGKPGLSSEPLTKELNRPITRSVTKGKSWALLEFKEGSKSNRICKKKNQRTIVVHKDKPVDICEALELLTLTQENFLSKLKQQREERRLKMEKENQSTNFLFNVQSSDGFAFTANEKRFHTIVLQELSARYRRKLLYGELSDSE